MASLVGKKAPLFTAPAVINGEEIEDNFSLNQYLGKKYVVFYFYPKDFTFVCPTEIHAFQEKLAQFEQRDVAVVACSCDTEESHLAWLNVPKEQGGIQGVTYPIVADAAKTIAHNFGVLAGDWNYDEEGYLQFEGKPVAYRGSFLIDKEGVVRHATINDLPLGRNIDEMIRLVDALRHVESHGEVCPANWEEGKEAMHATRQGVAAYLSNN
ncbi:peroxiredoxin [Cesiribacter andamanensis]|uniref:Thioredoxin peroxidase n=1 Tax=Cesiribacter andamanensis AMV16 TaxID=1279009 RepID=M7N4H8_9BACT|nr:peroxiredoxin [Cesiribacter andamanensis]EMR03578.1 putative peroxiredoxin [Cesiribacter andamanensis AMV16]